MAERGQRRKLVGTVVSTRMDKTALVVVERLTRHSAYEKYVRRRAKFMAHDPKSLCQMGDKVKIIESRPVSKRKRWQVLDIIERNKLEA
jgi:small subunit ribosomal protein S17